MNRENNPPAGRVIVVGTINVDLVCRVPALPRPGQTILADSVGHEFGGKGANQAVAAARQGAAVTLVGAVGDDADGRSYLEHLARERVEVSRVAIRPRVPTGTAHVYVDPRGENLIVVNRGANGCVDAELVRRQLPGLIRPGDVVAVQLECRLDAALEAVRLAAAGGARAVLNASPVPPAFPWGGQVIETVIVNEHECRELFGRLPRELCSFAPAVRREFLGRHGIVNLVISQGSDPTLWLSRDDMESVPTHPVVPRDTVGAGDTLAGVLAAALASGQRWTEALWRANVAAALSTLAVGAQTAMPARAEVDAVVRKGGPALAEAKLSP